MGGHLFRRKTLKKFLSLLFLCFLAGFVFSQTVQSVPELLEIPEEPPVLPETVVFPQSAPVVAPVESEAASVLDTASEPSAAAGPVETESALETAEPVGPIEPVGPQKALPVSETASPVASAEPVLPSENQQTAEPEPLPAAEYFPLEIDFPSHQLIDKYISEFSSNFGVSWLKDILNTAQVYRPYIRKKLAEYGMPQCLEFLPVIESNFNYKAVSKSGAVGLWQFMENSIGGYLIKNDWIDQRKDPWSSTDAALKKLKENYNYFGDWSLALAAYNMGLGGLSRLIASSGLKTFWQLADAGLLKTETKNYVPKFLAVADLITNSAWYGVDIPPYTDEYDFDFATVPVERQVDLEKLAEATGIKYETFKFLNPGLLYSVTPYAQHYDLRVLSRDVSAVSSALKTLDVYSADIYVVKQGDTLWGISRRFGTTVKDLCQENNIKENDILRIGTKLFVPINSVTK